MRISDWSSDVCSSDLDLISAGKWRELLATQEFTEPRNIFNAVVYGLRYSDHADRKASGHISTVEARQIMRRSGEHTSELQSLMRISYAVFCLKKKKKHTNNKKRTTHDNE